MRTIDLNSDMGEYDSPGGLALEAQLMPLITSANIACGVHAGHPDLMRRTARLASRHNVAIGAHPGFPDSRDFGRAARPTSPDEVATLVSTQLHTLVQVLATDHLQLNHVKLHGALYNLAARDQAIADAVVRAIVDFNRHLLLFASAGSVLLQSGTRAGLVVIQEAFADRAYHADGTLVPRSQPHALLQTKSQVRQQLHGILSGSVTSHNGQQVSIQADSPCVHADTPGTVDFIRLVRHEIESAGLRIARPHRA